VAFVASYRSSLAEAPRSGYGPARDRTRAGESGLRGLTTPERLPLISVGLLLLGRSHTRGSRCSAAHSRPLHIRRNAECRRIQILHWVPAVQVNRLPGQIRPVGKRRAHLLLRARRNPRFSGSPEVIVSIMSVDQSPATKFAMRLFIANRRPL
jgi:hypothetical protein